VVADGLDPAQTRVSQVMSKKLVTLDAAEPLEKVFDCLAQGHFRHLPITENGRIVGIVSLTDLAKMLKELAKEGRFLETFSGKVDS
jgi:CBS domain-containing protein